MARHARRISPEASDALASVEAAREVADAAEKTAAAAWADLRAKSVRAASVGAPKTRVATAAGIGPATIWRWIQEDAEEK